MTKDELIKLAVKYGWEYWKDSQELRKGQRYFMFRYSEVILRSWDGLINLKFNPPFLVPGKVPWYIGPFNEGWFSLKANRFVR